MHDTTYQGREVLSQARTKRSHSSRRLRDASNPELFVALFEGLGIRFGEGPGGGGGLSSVEVDGLRGDKTHNNCELDIHGSSSGTGSPTNLVPEAHWAPSKGMPGGGVEGARSGGAPGGGYLRFAPSASCCCGGWPGKGMPAGFAPSAGCCCGGGGGWPGGLWRLPWRRWSKKADLAWRLCRLAWLVEAGLEADGFG